MHSFGELPNDVKNFASAPRATPPMTTWCVIYRSMSNGAIETRAVWSGFDWAVPLTSAPVCFTILTRYRGQASHHGTDTLFTHPSRSLSPAFHPVYRTTTTAKHAAPASTTKTGIANRCDKLRPEQGGSPSGQRVNPFPHRQDVSDFHRLPRGGF